MSNYSPKPDGKPARTEQVNFTRPAAERIAKVVRKVEAGSRDQKPFGVGPRLQGVSSKTFRICTFTGAWSIDGIKTVTFRNQTATPNTLTASNLFFDIPDDGTKNCAVAKDGAAWYLVQWQWAIATCSTAAS